MSAFKLTTEQKETISWKLVVIFVLFTIGMIIIGVIYYKSQRNRISKEQQNNLTAIATLKTAQIQQWYSERLGDAATIVNNEPLVRQIKQFFRDENQPEIRRELVKWMRSVTREYNYTSVGLVDTYMKVRLSVSPSDSVTFEVKEEELQEIRDQKIIMTDLRTWQYLQISLIWNFWFRSFRVGPYPVEISARIIEINSSKYYQMIGRDITERKQAEEKIKASLKEKEVLLQEINHRGKNNLQVVSSLLNMQARTTKNKETIEILSESRDRINAMALIHAKLYESKSLSEVNMKVFIKGLIGQLFQSYPVQSVKITPIVNVADYPLPISMAVPVGLILNELLILI